MKRPKQTDKECRRQGMRDVPVANYSKMQDKYIDHLESKVKELILHNVSKAFTCEQVIKFLKNEEHLDDAIQFFESQK